MSPLSPEELKAHLANRPEWRVNGREIVRVFQFSDFRAALGFVNHLGILAEEAGHHPDIDIRYNKVRIALSTHDAGGITAKDFALASQADRLI